MKKKGLLIGVILIILYGIVMLILFGGKKNIEDNIKEEENIIESEIINDNTSKYLVIGNTSNWMLKNNEWKKVSSNTIENNSNPYKIYADNNYVGEYHLKYAKKWNIFNDKEEYLDYEGNIFAFSHNFDLKLIRFNAIELADDDKEFIKVNYNIKNFDMLLTNEVVNIDIDNNGEIDKIICLSSNGDNYDEKDDFYNLVIINLNGEYYRIIDQNKNNSNTLDLAVYSINRIFMYNSNIYLIIESISGIESDDPVSSNYLYMFNNNNFIKLFND